MWNIGRRACHQSPCINSGMPVACPRTSTEGTRAQGCQPTTTMRRGSLHAHIILWIANQDRSRVAHEIVACIPADVVPGTCAPPKAPARAKGPHMAAPPGCPGKAWGDLVATEDGTSASSDASSGDESASDGEDEAAPAEGTCAQFRTRFQRPSEPHQADLFDLVTRKQMHKCGPAGMPGCRLHGRCK